MLPWQLEQINTFVYALVNIRRYMNHTVATSSEFALEKSGKNAELCLLVMTLLDMMSTLAMM